MPLKLLRPALPYMRTTLVQPLPQRGQNQEHERLRGSALISMRKRVLLRSGGFCECSECRNGYPRPITWDTFELDHIQRIADGGSNAIDNLRALHYDCHARLTARQNAQVARYGCVLPEAPALPARVPHGQDQDDMPC